MFETDAAGEPVEVADLDAAGVLAILEQRKLDARAAERGKLRMAAHWCVLHPATADTGTATWAGASLLAGSVLDADESLGGDGTPAVSAFAPEPLAATLGVATQTAMKLIADALDLQHRLPRIWRLVERLEVEPYKARHVAQATHRLSQGRGRLRRRAARRPAALLQLEGRSRPPSPTPSRSSTPRCSSSARSGASSPGTSPCATPPRASTPAPPGSTSPATPST